MNSKKLVSALLAALSSVSLSGGNLSFAAPKKLEQGNNTVERVTRSKSRSKSSKLKTARKDNLGKGSNEIKNIEKDLNKNAQEGVRYKVVGCTVGGVVVAVAVVGLGIVGYKKIKIEDGNKKLLEELKDDEFIKVENKDFGPKVENGGKLFGDQNKDKDEVLDSDEGSDSEDDENEDFDVGGKMNENNVKKEEVKDDEGADLSCPKDLEKFEKAIIDEFGKFENWVDLALSYDALDADGRKVVGVNYGHEVDDSYFCASIGGKNILVFSGDWKGVDSAIAFGWNMIPGHIIMGLCKKYGKVGKYSGPKNVKGGKYSCPKNVEELKKRISNEWNNVEGFVDAALEKGMSDIKGRKLFVLTNDVFNNANYSRVPGRGEISFLLDDWKFNKGGFLGWDMISSDMVPDLFLGDDG